MKVLVWGINYAPETTGIAPCNTVLCEHLLAAGHEPQMLTSFAYYPAWKKRPEDQGQLYRTDHLRGVPVHRCWHYVPARVSALRRMVHEATFVAASFLRGLTLPKADVMVVVSPPLLLGAAAALLRILRRTPFVFHVQDLQPDAAVGLGMLKVGRFTRLLYRLEAFAYRQAAAVSGISHGMLKAFARKGVPESKRVYFPNGLCTEAAVQAETPGQWRAKQGFSADDFLIVYSGNLGVKQGLEVLVEAATRLRGPRVRIVICGQGAVEEKIRAGIERQRLTNLTLLPLQDARNYQRMMADTDVCVITQQAGTGQFFFPSKLLSAMAAAKTVLAVADADSELALALEEGNFGLRVEPDQPEKLAATMERMSGMDRQALRRMGETGQRYGEQFTFEKVLVDFEAVLRRVARQPVREAEPSLAGRI